MTVYSFHSADACLHCKRSQIAAFRAWEHFSGQRFGELERINQPCLVVNGVFDNMIPVRNSYMLSEHLPNAMLLTYPDAGHGSLNRITSRPAARNQSLQGKRQTKYTIDK